MADVMGDEEFWLPSEFLTDDDVLLDNPIFHRGRVTIKNNREPRFCFPPDYPYSLGSSPVESLAGSTETESDEDEYLAGLARSLFHVQAENRDRPSSVFATENPKIMGKTGGSPQSPLCGMGSWTSCSGGSSQGTPNGRSLVSSPPTGAFNGKEDAWDLLYAAAGQMARMELNDNEAIKYSRGGGLVGGLHKPNPLSVPLRSSSFQALTPQQIQASHLLQLKKQQQELQQQQYFPLWERQAQQHNGGRLIGLGVGNGRCTRPPHVLPPSAWPPMEQNHQNGSGMRAVFIGVGGRRRECTGTGVFLPRTRNGVSSEPPQRKHGCSTVLLPDRVVQALNRSFHDMDMASCVPLPKPQHQQQRNVGGLGGGVPLHPYHQQRSYSVHQAPINNTEVQLPQEWTY